MNLLPLAEDLAVVKGKGANAGESPAAFSHRVSRGRVARLNSLDLPANGRFILLSDPLRIV